MVPLTLVSALWKRDQNDGGLGDSSRQYDYENHYDDDDGYGESWWWSPTGMAVRYTIITILFAAILLYFIGGYWHAQRRIRKGLPPRAYHAWMIRRSHRYRNPQAAQQNPYVPQSQYQQPEGGYAMPGYPQPPPAYNPFSAPPPAYQPPEGGSKTMADQHYPAGVNREGEPSHLSQPLPALPRQ
ncbi:Hypothetical predicted protein [Lecanosticta acicola]|uniref:Uncharacterized protein n=1 Tax=Lecanosticta acicola TaxID=111012 RepID=A0AAI8Z1L6_9PEZI|nr:Hypothetical predicted protein [Lecanosticta acicola]